MKKMIMAATAVISMGLASTAFAVDYPANVFGGFDPTVTSNTDYSWVAGSVASGASVHNYPSPGNDWGALYGNMQVYANTGTGQWQGDFNAVVPGNNNTVAGLWGDYYGEVSTESPAASANAGIGGVSGAWQDGSTAYAYTQQYAGGTVVGAANLEGYINGGALANFNNNGEPVVFGVGTNPFNNNP
ncbi:MAG: hypothetical protein HGA77_10200 [Chlorobiaceae bacterium]|nr:hypothetical protein [Chlorobiaceae bacterium]